MPDAPPEPAAQRAGLGCAWLAVGVATVAWGGMLWSGYSLWLSARTRFPDSPHLVGQWRGYVLLPAIATIVAIGLGGALWRWRRSATPVAMASIVLILCLMAFLASYGGGV